MNKEEMQRQLLEQLGLKLEDLPEPIPPSEDEVRRCVTDLLDIDKASKSADVLIEWPDQAVMALRAAINYSGFIEKICKSEPLQQAFFPIIKLLCKSAPDLIVEKLVTLSEFPEQVSEQCIETAFRHDTNKLVPLFSQFVDEEQNRHIRAALVGIRAAARNHGFTVSRQDPLYQLCLRICLPDYPTKPQIESLTSTDPAIFVCQSFGSLAEVDLARMPYFSFDNPHFEEILCWLPSVVSNAATDLVRSEFARAAELHDRDANSRGACRYFIPLAAKKLGSECRDAILRMLSSEPKKLADALRGPVTKAFAIVECGRDPLSDASDAIRKGEFGTLSKFEQAVPLFLAFDGEVRNGGIFQFLFNSSGILASETLESLRLMNDLPGQALLEAGIAAAMSEAQASSPHIATRHLGTNFLRKKFRDSIDELQRAYFEQCDGDLRLYTFVLAHVNQYRVN
jgi:hypothetical protein